MDIAGLWKLFWVTGHPAVWVMIHRLEREQADKTVAAFYTQERGAQPS